MTIKVAGKDVEGSPFRAVIAPGYEPFWGDDSVLMTSNIWAMTGNID